MKRTPVRALLWLVAILLIASPSLIGGARPARPNDESAHFVTRLLGPFSELAAQMQWIRVQHAIRSGRSERALARAETALSLDPHNTEGWRFVATYLALDLGSPNTEPNPARRRALIRSGLQLLERGERTAESRQQLALWSGLILITHAEIDPELGWPTGTRGLWSEAADAFDRAVELGSTEAEALAHSARERASD